MVRSLAVVIVPVVALAVLPTSIADEYRVALTITSELHLPNVPFDPVIDFAALLGEAGVEGVLDPDSIRVIDVASGQTIDHELDDDFFHSDRGRILWVVCRPADREYEIRFRTESRRPANEALGYQPLIGVGDLLHYGAGVPRPIAPIYLSRLVDLNGDGRRDLVGCWNYAHRPGLPWDGIFCYPRTGDEDRFEFGRQRRLRYRDVSTPARLHHFSKIYMDADVADLDGDGLVDVVYSPSGGTTVFLYRNTGDRDAGGMPIFESAGQVDRGTTEWRPCRAVDLNGDRAMDLVVGDMYLKNTNARRWPIEFASPVELNDGDSACFCDVDGDGRLDSVCLVPVPDTPHARRVAWRRNTGGDPPMFKRTPRVINGLDQDWCTDVAAVRESPRRGLLVQHSGYQRVSFYEHSLAPGGAPRFTRFDTARSKMAEVALGDQAWPCVCDWDDDGDWDLLVGGGYGHVKIVINEGSSLRPALAEARRVLAEGKPIRILRDEVLGSKHWHNMGYPFPVHVDWDGDTLPDLVVPNETNRIFWYRNVGTRETPRFGPRRQVIVDGFPDTPEARARSARLAADENVPNSPYPLQESRPFFWRTGAAIADFNGDGLLDLVTHDGATRKVTLFARYRNASGELRLRKDRPLQLADGRLIDDAIVGRVKHWTESFRAADWDGDGLLDLFYSCAGTEAAKGSIYLLRNVGTAIEPVFAAPRTLCAFGEPIKVTEHGPHPWIADMNGDGLPDILTCVEWSVFPFYAHAAIEMDARPEYAVGAVEGLEDEK